MASPPLRRIAPAMTLALLSAGLVGFVAMWAATTPSVPRTVGAELIEIGRLTGLVGGYLALVLLLLMARIPVLENAVGADRLARWHAVGGRTTVGMLSVHALALWWGYALTERQGLDTVLADLLFHYEDVLLATLGFTLMVLIGVLSARAARRRLPYEAWYWLHLSAYAAVALAFLHVLSNGAQFIATPVNRWAWIGLYVVVGAALLWWRLVVPIHHTIRDSVRVLAVNRENRDTVSLVLSWPSGRGEAGQFVRCRFLCAGQWWQSHPYSLSAPPAGGMLRITVKALGDSSSALARLRRGTPVLVAGPYGAVTDKQRHGQKIALVAGGVGISPMRALFESTGAADAVLLYRAHAPRDLVFRAELDHLAASRPGRRVHYLVGSRAQVPIGRHGLRRLVPDLTERDVYVCGPGGFMREVRNGLVDAGVNPRRIHAESFDLGED